MTVRPSRHALLVALLAAGCAAPVPPAASPAGGEATAGARAGTGKAPATAPSSRAADTAVTPASSGPSAAPSAAASASAAPAAGAPLAPALILPSVAPLPLASAIAPPVITAPAGTAAPGAGTTPYKVPRTVSLAIPVGLQALTGVKLIGMDGSTLIGMDGSTMVAAGGGNYRLQQAAAGQGAAFMLAINTMALFQALAIVGAILQGVAPLNLQPDTPVTFDDNDHPGKKVTLVLRVAADHARLDAFRAPAQSLDPAHQFLGLRFTDEAHGKVVMRTLPDEPGDRRSIAETWDFAAGTLVADGAVDQAKNGEGVAQRTNARWELAKVGEPAGAVFALRAALHARKANEQGPSTLGCAANFAAGGGGAHWLRVSTPATAGKAIFLPADGLSWGLAPPAPFGFYVGADGKDLGSGAPDALKAILPLADAPLPAFPPDPDAGDAFADPRFDFPD